MTHRDDDPFRTSRGLPRFARRCDAVFADVLAGFGFARTDRVDEHPHYGHTYRAGARYVAVLANLDPADAPNHCELLLGEGSDDEAERELNALPIAAFASAAHADGGDPTDDPGAEYELASPRELTRVLERMRRDLLLHAQDFLIGDLTRFRALRGDVAGAWPGEERRRDEWGA